jgi:hypothetical protein
MESAVAQAVASHATAIRFRTVLMQSPGVILLGRTSNRLQHLSHLEPVP